MQGLRDEIFGLETLPAVRGRLVRLCAHLSGDADAAEDLAQETLLEAWRHMDKLHTPSSYLPWLWAIARHVCQRHRQRSNDQVQTLPQVEIDDRMADESDLEVELDRDELAELLDQALALLPPVTRAVLIERYIQGLPQAEVAARLGLNESVVA